MKDTKLSMPNENYFSIGKLTQQLARYFAKSENKVLNATKLNYDDLITLKLLFNIDLQNKHKVTHA